MTKPNNEAPSQSADKYIVRFPDGMRDRIAEAAKTNNRSMNAEIIARLQSSFTEPSAGIQFSRASPSDDSDTFFELIRAQRKTIDTQETAILALQSYLVEVINSLPKKLQSDERVKVAEKFALDLSGDESQASQMPLVIDLPTPSKDAK